MKKIIKVFMFIFLFVLALNKVYADTCCECWTETGEYFTPSDDAKNNRYNPGGNDTECGIWCKSLDIYVNGHSVECSKNASGGVVSTVPDSQTTTPAKSGGGQSASLDINNEGLTCRQILGNNISNVVKAGITIFQIACIIISIIRGMTILIPALIDKGADKDNKKTGELVVLLIVLTVALLFKPIISLLGKVLDFDVSCII